MVNQNGQSLTEFLVVTGILMAAGLLLLELMTGPDRQSGAIQNMATHAATAIANDKD